MHMENRCIFLDGSSHCMLRESLTVEPRSHFFYWLCPEGPLSSTLKGFPSAGIIGSCHAGTEDLNMGLGPCVASTLSIESLPQPSVHFFKIILSFNEFFFL